MKWTTTREAIQTALAWAYLQKGDGGMVGQALLGCQIDNSPRNEDWVMVANLEAGQICAEINAQKPPIAAWLHFCYGPEDSPHDQGQVASQVIQVHFETVGGMWRDRYIQMAHIATLDYKCRILSEGQRPLPREVYLNGVGIHHSNWVRRGFEVQKQLCLDTLASMDKEGIGAVSRVVKAIRTQESVHIATSSSTSPL
jgi:hypothetical protein